MNDWAILACIIFGLYANLKQLLQTPFSDWTRTHWFLVVLSVTLFGFGVHRILLLYKKHIKKTVTAGDIEAAADSDKTVSRPETDEAANSE